ncbi:MAG: zinc ribbon domain-containing protein [Verrucomicrobia bacterium]|nr:zinc ribbon domain-containing protein [Verrucomicrobiota bacterium]MCH8526490.1 zinc ribbon domain-containing protein [Kiritimatiellia bacterium]
MPPEKIKRPGVACPVCKTPNDFGRPFCKNCGARIYAGGQVLPSIEKKKNSRMRAIQASVASFLCVLFAVIFGLLAWPFEPLGTVGSPAEAAQTQRILIQLQRDLSMNTPWRGYAVSESGWNVYSELNIQEPMQLRVSAAEDQIVAVAHTRLFGARLSTRIVMVRSEEKDYFVPYSLWIGHLPLPVRYSGRIARSRAESLGLQVEEIFWERVRIERVERGNMILTLKDRGDG